MAATEAGKGVPRVVRLGSHEVAAGRALSDAAGWNQTDADWRHFLDKGHVFAARAPGGAVVSTAALLPYPPGAWISLVLVHPDWRRQGLATLLLNRCLDEARERGLQCWLDATPDGAKVYEPLGFRVVGELVRLRRPRVGRGIAASEMAAAGTALPGLIDEDRRALGFGRAGLLAELAARPGSSLYSAEEAMCLVRDGSRARHLGPFYAPDEAAAEKLLDHVLAGEPGETIIDLLAERRALRKHLTARGFTGERPFLRMVRGDGTDARDTRRFMAGAGPEYG